MNLGGNTMRTAIMTGPPWSFNRNVIMNLDASTTRNALSITGSLGLLFKSPA